MGRTRWTRRTDRTYRGVLAGLAAVAVAVPLTVNAPGAAAAGPVMVDPHLLVRPFVTGIARPVSMAFLPDGSAFVLEKGTGRVDLVRGGAVVATVLDLDVNSNTAPQAERGLLGIALHPQFPAVPDVYLYWSESSKPGSDTLVPADSPLLGNRVDRFSFDGTRLTWVQNLLHLRSRRDDDVGVPEDPSKQKAGHVGGVLRFGPDGKLYVVTGDVGRRGLLQNLACGPTQVCPGPVVRDDFYGGPLPDDAHLTGTILRLEPDGSAPADNPFYAYGAQLGGEVGRNLQKVFAYGIRNSFGLAFDPVSGALWEQENGEDAFDEINRVDPGFNSGWLQIAGPLARYQDWRRIETTEFPAGAGETRYPTASMAPTAEEALARLTVLPGSHYSDPEFSWKYVYPPAGIGFIAGKGLGGKYHDDLVVGAVRDGVLLRFHLTGNRTKVGVDDDPRLEDRVADNTPTARATESESLVFGTGFGVATDLQTGPDGHLYVIDHIGGTIWEVYRRLNDHGDRRHSSPAASASSVARAPSLVQRARARGVRRRRTARRRRGRRTASRSCEERDAGRRAGGRGARPGASREPVDDLDRLAAARRRPRRSAPRPRRRRARARSRRRSRAGRGPRAAATSGCGPSSPRTAGRACRGPPGWRSARSACACTRRGRRPGTGAQRRRRLLVHVAAQERRGAAGPARPRAT